MEPNTSSTPLKKPKMLRGVPSKLEKIVFYDSSTNQPIDESTISLLVVDNLAKLKKEAEPKSKEPRAKSNKYSYFTHRESANYLGLKSAIKKVFSNFKFSDNHFKDQLDALREAEARNETSQEEVFELPDYTTSMAEKQGITIPMEYDVVFDIPTPPVLPSSTSGITFNMPPISVSEIVKPDTTSTTITNPAVNYDGVTSKYSDHPELDIDANNIETNLNISSEEAEQKRREKEEGEKTVINDDTNPIPDVHLDLEKLDKDLLIFDKPKKETLGQIETEKVVMPEGKTVPFAPKDNSVFTPEFEEEYLNMSEDEMSALHGSEEKKSVSLVNTETGEKQVLFDMSKDRTEVAEVENPQDNTTDNVSENSTISTDNHRGTLEREIVKGKKTYKLKKYKQDIIPEDVKPGRAIAWLSYILFFIPLLFNRHNTFVRHHANEGLELNIMEIVAAGLILPFFLLEHDTITTTYVLAILAAIGLILSAVLAVALVLSIILSMCGLSSNLPFFWGFRFIKVANHKKVNPDK